MDGPLKPTPANAAANSDRENTLDSAAALIDNHAPEFGSIGPYRLISKLGEGGMGRVWLAEQSAPVKRQVALKIIKAGRYDDSSLLRFDLERQTLAIMDHPAIAKVFDAGSTTEGQPYFVMEHVPGLPVTEYCDRKQLPIRERLDLFIKVCEGVQHAHQKAIMHRDLKPSNILVVEVDGKPMPRIIDFGLAKALSQQSEDFTLMTRVGGMVGTPGYMSPEQADPSMQDVDTRTDVYSLGVVLHELLTGVLPFDVKRWQTEPYHEMLRKLHEEDPGNPSTRVTEDPTSPAVAERRSTEPRQLAHLLRGDLDWITLKALERDRSRRYGTPSDLAADLNRYLQNQPVTARPASVGYRARKYVQRHKALVASTAAVFVVLVAGIVTSTWQAVRARAAERRAISQAAVARATNNFLENDLLAQANVNNTEAQVRADPDLRVRTVLDRAAARIAGKFDDQPEVEASIRHTIGQAYLGLGVYPEAERQMGRALELRRKVLGKEGPETLQSMYYLALSYHAQGKYVEAEALYNQTLEIQRRVLGPEHPDTLLTMFSLGNTYFSLGKPAQTEALYRQVLEIRRRVLGPEHPDTLSSMNSVAAALTGQGEYSQAEAMYNQTLEIRKRVWGPEHPNTLLSMWGLARCYFIQGRYELAESLYRQTWEIERRVLGPENPGTLSSMAGRANTLASAGHYPEAEKVLRELYEIQRRVLGPEHPDTITNMSSLADTLNNEGHYAEAEKLHRETLAIRRRVLGPEDPGTLLTLEWLALDLSHEGRYVEAEKLFREALQTALKTNRPEVIGLAWYNFACGAAITRHHDKALQYLRKAIDHGCGSAGQLASDPDLKSLHGDRRFEALVAKLREAARRRQ